MIKIVDSNPNWPKEFNSAATKIRTIVGKAALRIDHIGSTSVDNLVAKDIIDIQITVQNITNQCVIDRLVENGYQHKEHIQNDLLVGFSKEKFDRS